MMVDFMQTEICSVFFRCIEILATGPRRAKHSDQTKIRHMEVVFKGIQDKTKTQREMNKDKYPCKSEINGSGMPMLPLPSFIASE